MSDQNVQAFLDRTPMRAILGIPDEILDQAMAVAYQAYRASQYDDAEVLCKGLLAADHRYWWVYSLYAAVLRNQGRLEEALVQVECGLRYEPQQPKLVAMRKELRTLIAMVAARQSKKEAA
jgi:predicted Zn-dependent protease